MTWVSLLVALFKLTASLTEYLRDKKLIDGATAALILDNLRLSNEAIASAQAAREAARADNATGDPRLRDDGFKRPDDG